MKHKHQWQFTGFTYINTGDGLTRALGFACECGLYKTVKIKECEK